jgi:hypothetical protein
MKCTSYQQASRVAFFGAQKMDGQGYTYEPITRDPLTGKITTLRVTPPTEGHVGYIVTTDTQLEDLGIDLCNCPFYADNAEYRICKHVTRGRQFADDEAESEADAEARYYAEMNAHVDFGLTYDANLDRNIDRAIALHGNGAVVE